MSFSSQLATYGTIFGSEILLLVIAKKIWNKAIENEFLRMLQLIWADDLAFFWNKSYAWTSVLRLPKKISRKIFSNYVFLNFVLNSIKFTRLQ